MVLVMIAAAGLWQTGTGLWIHAKARLAQHLLERAWRESLVDGTAVRPWPWADTWPVARLIIPARDLDLFVLQGDSGRSLAFGPGLAAGSSAPGQPGTTLISAHRDTHFRGLANLERGAAVYVETAHGRWRYRVTHSRIIDARVTGIGDDPMRDTLVLATCYPFDGWSTGGPLRYVVYATAA
jgi:sortase A